MQDQSHNNRQDNLRAENDFLKMKLMLEHGGSFEGSNAELPPEIEHQFLSNIMAFEKQFAQQKTISVFEKIGRPQQFKPVSEIPDAEIETEWNSIKAYMFDHGVDLAACSPNVSAKELYRFATEELFQKQTNDINLPGWITSFIYDEFYPDPFYENSMLVEQQLLPGVFSKDEIFNPDLFPASGFGFNDRQYDDMNCFEKKLQRFKSLFDNIELRETDIQHCEVRDGKCRVKGKYEACASSKGNELVFSGQFIVELIASEDRWYFANIILEGFRLE